MANNEGLGLSATFQYYSDARTLSWDQMEILSWHLRVWLSNSQHLAATTIKEHLLQKQPDMQRCSDSNNTDGKRDPQSGTLVNTPVVSADTLAEEKT